MWRLPCCREEGAEATNREARTYGVLRGRDSGTIDIDVTRMVRTALRRRCPACGQGELFREGYRLHDRCPSCGVDLRGAHGAHYGGPIVLGYTVGAVTGLAVLTLLGWLFGLRTWVVWTSVAALVASIFASYRSCKALWVWFLYATDEIGERGEWKRR